MALSDPCLAVLWRSPSYSFILQIKRRDPGTAGSYQLPLSQIVERFALEVRYPYLPFIEYAASNHSDTERLGDEELIVGQ